MNKKKLHEVLAIQSESYGQFRMFAYIIRYIQNIPNVSYYVDGGNVYITKGYTMTYPCVVAHMDTVHEICEELHPIEYNGNITGFNRVTMQQVGIGGDDKVGIFIALQCLEQFDNIKIAFFRDEEVGCDGSYDADMGFFEDCRFVLQCDRRGNDDFVTTASGVELSSDEFRSAISNILAAYNYKFAHGMITDVMALKQNGIKCSVANMSCGYYRPHCADEFVNIVDVENCLDMCKSIIHNCTGMYPHTPKPRHQPQFSYSKNVYTKLPKPISNEIWYEEPKPKHEATYCTDCWRDEANEDGLCKTCQSWYASLNDNF